MEGLLLALKEGCKLWAYSESFQSCGKCKQCFFINQPKEKSLEGTVLEVLRRGGIFENQDIGGMRPQCHRGKTSLEEKVPTTSDSGAKVFLGCQSKEPRATNSSTGATDGDSCW